MAPEYDATVDYYSLLLLQPTCTAAQIASAFRKLSIKVHPDRFPNKADEFIALKIASDVLLDPESRAKWEREFMAGKEAMERRAKLDGRRRAMVEELERAEEKAGEKERGREVEREVERLKEEGKRWREARGKRAKEKEEEEERERKKSKMEQEDSMEGEFTIPLGPLDTTLSLRVPPPSVPVNNSLPFLSSTLNKSIESLISKPRKPSKKNKSLNDNTQAVVVQFKSLDSTLKCIEACKSSSIEWKWASGSPPACLSANKTRQDEENEFLQNLRAQNRKVKSESVDEQDMLERLRKMEDEKEKERSEEQRDKERRALEEEILRAEEEGEESFR